MGLLYAALAYMVGVALGKLVWDRAGLACPLPNWLWLLPVAALGLAPLLDRLRVWHAGDRPLRWPESAGFVRPRRALRPATVAVLLFCVTAGLLRYLGQPFSPCLGPHELAYYNLPATAAFDRRAPQVTILAHVDSYPLVADTQQQVTVQARTIEVAGVTHAVTGAARLKTGSGRRYEYGQPIRITGRLVTPPELDGFSYREYLARKGIRSLVYSPKIQMTAGSPQGSPLLRALYAVRARGEGFLNRGLPEPYAALANGMLLGIQAGIPDELYEQFNATATSHVIVISGSNVALIAGVIGAAAVRVVGRKRAVWPTVAGIACYALLVGGDAAVLRAAVMGSLVVVATTLDRRSTALVSLAAACALMTVLNPLALWDVGLQLSSGATAGLILFVPVLTEWSRRGFARLPINARWLAPVQSYLEDALLVTVAANLMTLPLVFHNFGRLSTVSLVTNLLIAPVQALIMLWGSAAVSLGAAGLEPVGRVLLAVPWLALAWTVAMVRWTASWPGASLEIGHFGAPALALSYARPPRAALARAGAAGRRHPHGLSARRPHRPDRGPGSRHRIDGGRRAGVDSCPVPAGRAAARLVPRHRPGRRHFDPDAARAPGARGWRGEPRAALQRTGRRHAVLGSRPGLTGVDAS